MSITNPADCEVHSLIRFLNAKNICPDKIHRQLAKVYGEGVMNERNVCKWCHLFNEERTDAHNEAQSRHLSGITEDLKDGVDNHVHENRHLTIDELNEIFPYVSRSVLHETVIVQL
jgi:hypothetical protein